MENKPNCFITNECAQKLKYYVNATKMEISGIGKSEIRDGDIYITDIKIYKQKCTGSSTDLDETDMARVQYQMDKDGEDLSQWNVWWHSHATMSVFWSGTDNATVNSHANNGGFLVSLVTNHKGDYKTRVDIFPKDVSPFNVVSYMKIMDDIPTSILPVNYNPERAKVLDDILTAGYKLVDDKISEIESWASTAIKSYEDEVMATLNKYKEDVTIEKNKLVKAAEDSFDTDNKELIEEYNSLSGFLEENEELLETITKEVNEKVSTIVYTPPKNSTLWFNKEKKDSSNLDDIDFSRKDDLFNSKNFDKSLNNIMTKYNNKGINEDDEDDIILTYVKPKSKKQLKRETKARERRELSFTVVDKSIKSAKKFIDNNKK